MYISHYIKICKKDKFYIIYAPAVNTTVLVSDEVLTILDRLLSKFGCDPIDEMDKDFLAIKESLDYALLKKHYIFTDNYMWLTEKYIGFNPKLGIAYLHVTQECNLRCTYCYAQHNLGKGMMMNAKSAETYINRLYERGVRTFVITGGEPLLNPEIGEIISLIHSKDNTTIEFLTNGTLINGNEGIIENVDHIIVSLDVGKSEKRRGISAEKLLSMLEMLPQELRKKTDIRSVISKGEERLLPEMRRKIEQMGFGYLSIPRLPNCAEDLKEFPDVSLIEDPKELVDTLTMVRCGAATSEIAVDWNGDVYPCQNLMRKEHLITNLDKCDWYEELQKSSLREILRQAHVLNIEKCRDCDVRFVCGGGCRALSYNVYKCYDHCLDFYCDHFKRYAIQKLSRVRYKNFGDGDNHDI